MVLVVATQGVTTAKKSTKTEEAIQKSRMMTFAVTRTAVTTTHTAVASVEKVIIPTMEDAHTTRAASAAVTGWYVMTRTIIMMWIMNESDDDDDDNSSGSSGRSENINDDTENGSGGIDYFVGHPSVRRRNSVHGRRGFPGLRRPFINWLIDWNDWLIDWSD